MKKPAADLTRMSMDLSRFLRRTMEQGLGDVNILRLHALVIIEEQGELTMTDFAATMNISPSSATEFADRLIKCGYIARVTDAGNRRKVLITLTPLGRTIVRKGRARKEKLLSTMFSALSSKDRAHLQRIFGLLLQKHIS